MIAALPNASPQRFDRRQWPRPRTGGIRRIRHRARNQRIRANTIGRNAVTDASFTERPYASPISRSDSTVGLDMSHQAALTPSGYAHGVAKGSIMRPRTKPRYPRGWWGGRALNRRDADRHSASARVNSYAGWFTWLATARRRRARPMNPRACS